MRGNDLIREWEPLVCMTKTDNCISNSVLCFYRISNRRACNNVKGESWNGAVQGFSSLDDCRSNPGPWVLGRLSFRGGGWGPRSCILSNSQVMWVLLAEDPILSCMKVHICVRVRTQSFSCVTLCNPLNLDPPGSSIHGVFQARTLEWVAISSSRGSSRPKDGTHISCIHRWILHHWAAREAPHKGVGHPRGFVFWQGREEAGTEMLPHHFMKIISEDCRPRR